MNGYNLRPLWDELLTIYKVFAALCDKYHLRYYACGGTALGAVRHKGFIPWDDDFDMFMPRLDYKRFIEVAISELPGGYAWVSIENDENYNHPFGKIVVNDEIKVRKIQSETKLELHQGIYIDILPLDGVPAVGFKCFIWLLKRSIWRHMHRYIKLDQNARLSQQRWRSAIPFDGASRVEDSKESARRLWRTSWTNDTFGTPVWMNFESVKVPLPHDWDKYLKGMFGDKYMQLPPIEQRKPSHQFFDN